MSWALSHYVYINGIGEYSVSIKGHKDIESSPVHYLIEVDPEKKTYKTVQNLNPQKLQSESINTSLATSSYNSITVAIWTKDPIGIYTCSSNQALNFNYSDGSISYSTRSKGQWDGQPTGGNTNWYCQYNNFGTFYQGGSTVSTSINAKHYNYDFMDASLYTYANHYITLYGYGNGSTDYSIDWNYSGEYSYLLGTEVDVF